MSASIAPSSPGRSSLVKPLAWLGIVFAAIAIGLAVMELVSPSQIGERIVAPSVFQLENALFPICFLGWVFICCAFYFSGATRPGWLAILALAIAILSAIVSSYQSLASAMSIANVQLPDWVDILQLGLVLVAPLLLGVAALWARVIPMWQALYPIIVVAIVSMAFWGFFGETTPSIPIIVQAVAWIGFGFLTLGVKPNKV